MSEQIPENPTAPELDLTFDPEQLRRFERYHKEGPIIGFVPGDADEVRLVVMEHDTATYPRLPYWDDENSIAHELFHAPEGMELAQLVFTPKEWVAFCAGVEIKEYEAVYRCSGDISVRDSKNPDKLILCFTREGYCSLIDAVKLHMYDLPERQHAALRAELDAELEVWLQNNKQKNVDAAGTANGPNRSL